ncbi:MAG: hypothetical protein HY730_00490 [Candidatus Tectomicrobia bacterium]|uniref:Transposase n=1 Tax=Tectimicrobiota bacterium TaxID=2528274 RepID=A0A933LP73_UNCTE|nr:hypothetical protein [Candidatus Tectomicrobia bacterium]
MKIFRFIDWLMVLPKDLVNSFTEALRQFEKEKKMRYVTSIERQGMEKGMKQGLQQGVQQGVQQGLQQGILLKAREDVLDILEARFGTVPQTIHQAISASEDISLLKVLHKKAALVASLEEFEKIREKTLPL